MANFFMFGKQWIVPEGMTKAQAMAAVSAGSMTKTAAGNTYLDPTADDQDLPDSTASITSTLAAVPAQEAAAFPRVGAIEHDVIPSPTQGVTQPGAGLEGGVMPEYDEAGNYQDIGLATAGMALVPAALGGARLVSGSGAQALGVLARLLTSGGKQALAYLGIGVAAETLIPGETLPFTPSIGEIAETVGDWGQKALDLAPGGMIPGERATRERVLAHLSQQTGVQITALTQLPQGGWMGSYLSSPSAKKKRGFYIGPGGFPIRTWANRGMAVISRDPRGSALSKGARALDKATNRFVRADKVAAKVKKRIRTKARK